MPRQHIEHNPPEDTSTDIREGMETLTIPESWVSPLRTALMVVDMQNDYCHERGALSLANDALPFYTTKFIQGMEQNLMRLVRVAHEIGLKVIYTRSEYGKWTNSSNWIKRGAGKELRICEPGSWGAEWYRVNPRDDELVLVKHRYSPFLNTAMEIVLRANAIETVIVSGVTTNVCVEATARDAFMRDFRVIVVEDCVASYDEEVHRASLTNIGRHFGMVASSPELLRLWGRGGG